MICFACQNGVLKQMYADHIYCESCGSKWNNTSFKNSVGRKQSYSKAWKAGRQ